MKWPLHTKQVAAVHPATRLWRAAPSKGSCCKEAQIFCCRVRKRERRAGWCDPQPPDSIQEAKIGSVFDRRVNVPSHIWLLASKVGVWTEQVPIGWVGCTCSAHKVLSQRLISSAPRWRCCLNYLTAAQKAATPSVIHFPHRVCVCVHMCLCVLCNLKASPSKLVYF